jgi:hypothetical protein
MTSCGSLRVGVALMLLASLAVPAPAHAAEPVPELRLVLIGGGTRPAEAMERFAEWAGGAQARVLVAPSLTLLRPGQRVDLRGR